MKEELKISTIKKRINVGLFAQIIYFILLLFCFVYGYLNQKILEEASESRYQSYILADRLRQSSDDLTNLVRTYIATGDTLYKKQFYEVIKIRKGEAFRPYNYNRVYWELISDSDSVAPFEKSTQKLSLIKLMQNADFSSRELELLQLSEENSDKLVRLEEEAMAILEEPNIRDEKIRPESLKRLLALEILYCEEYRNAKKDILKPINEVYASVEERTNSHFNKQSIIIRNVIISLFVLFILTAITFYFLFKESRNLRTSITNSLRRQVDEKTKEINESKQILEEINSELKRSNEELEQFAYVASHDLQEPLRKIKSFTQLLGKKINIHLDEKTHEYMNSIFSAVSRMHSLINDLLSFSRVNNRAGDFKAINLDRALNEVIQTLELKIEQSNSKITVEKLPVLYADEGQMIQLFQNLISNAIKFNDKDIPIIEIGVDKEDLHFITLFVKDNGIGIDEKYLDKVFDIFQRLHKREDYDGTGIGLAISKKIMERHNGKINIESIPGEGTVIYMKFPKIM